MTTTTTIEARAARAAEKWFAGARAVLEANRQRTGDNFADAGHASFELATEKLAAIITAEMTGADEEAATILREIGTSLRTLDAFPCNDPAHDDNLNCECFWERIEQWLAGSSTEALDAAMKGK